MYTWLFRIRHSYWVVSLVLGLSPISCYSTHRNIFDRSPSDARILICKEIESLETRIKGSNSFKESYRFLKEFLHEANLCYHTSITLPHACKLVKENLNQLELSREVQALMISFINSIEKLEAKSSNIYQSKRIVLTIKIPQRDEPFSEEDIPDEMVIGMVETFGGALLCIIPHPVSFTIGTAMVGDGVRRVLDSLDSNDQETKEDEEKSDISK